MDPSMCAFFAEVALLYTLACMIYYLSTRVLPTPLADSLTPYQKLLKAESTRVRGKIFVASLLGAMLTVRLIAPCMK